jgi:hypothetical protein
MITRLGWKRGKVDWMEAISEAILDRMALGMEGEGEGREKEVRTDQSTRSKRSGLSLELASLTSRRAMSSITGLQLRDSLQLLLL